MIISKSFSLISIIFFSYFIISFGTFSPTISPSLSFNLPLPPSSSSIISLAPTYIPEDSIKNPAIEFRITALAVLFSVSGIIFFLILTHHSVLFLLRKKWDEDDVSKWELSNQNDERQMLLNDIENGIKKPDIGIQWNESDINNQDIKRLEPSWIREKDFSMQWENINEIISQNPNQFKILIANPKRWKSENSTGGVSSPQKGGKGNAQTGNNYGKIVLKRDKKIQPTLSSLEPGILVNIHIPSGGIRPGKILSIHEDNSDMCRVEFTDEDGGIEDNIRKDMIELQYLTQFHLEIDK